MCGNGFFTFPFPPIPMQSIPIPSHSHSQFCDYFHFHPIPMDLFPFPFLFPCSGPKYYELTTIYVKKTKSAENCNTRVMPILWLNLGMHRVHRPIRDKCITDNVVALSRVCAVAQYAVLEANGKVNGIGEISNPFPSQTLGPIWMPLQIYHYVPPGSRCAKFD